MSRRRRPHDPQKDNDDSDDNHDPQQQQQQQQEQLLLQRRLTTMLTSDETARTLQRRHSHGMVVAGEHVMELEWEEWDGKSPFWHHCLAGSFAGVCEHTLLYPVDTVKTYMQSYCADCPRRRVTTNSNNIGGGGMLNALRQLTTTMSSTTTTTTTTAAKTSSTGSSTSAAAAALLQGSSQQYYSYSSKKGFGRLWRGVQAMMLGCIPAHALYFSSYEMVKSLFLSQSQQQQQQQHSQSQQQQLGPLGSSVAGATAAFCHDLIMTPVDTVKQRLQLGHYHGMADAVRTMWKHEGPMGLYRAFPVTLLTNLPYGMVMVMTNEYLRDVLLRRSSNNNHDDATATLTVQTTMLAGCGAGMAAAAVTTPLDRLKTRLQTQGLGSGSGDAAAMMLLRPAECSSTTTTTTTTTATNGTTTSISNNTPPKTPPAVADCPKRALLLRAGPKYQGVSDAFQSIVREEGWAGLWRGMTPRLLTHAPAVAISWTTYEAAKLWLSSSSSR